MLFLFIISLMVSLLAVAAYQAFIVLKIIGQFLFFLTKDWFFSVDVE